MSSIGNLRRTDAARPLPLRLVASLVAALILCVLLISFRPFQPASTAIAGSGGDLVNQLGFGALGGIAVLAMMVLANPRTLLALISPMWILMFGFLFLSTFAAIDPAAAQRAVLFTLIAVLCVVAVLALPRDADGFSLALVIAAFAVLILSYAGLVAVPDLAKHTANEIEAQHAGLWRGIFAHKNIAGPVMAAFSFGGIYLIRRGWRGIGIVLLVLALWFVAHTGSKTATALVPIVVFLVMFPNMFGFRLLAALLIAAALTGFFFFTIGTLFFPATHDLLVQIGADTTFTGRTSIWQFALEKLSAKPWSGYGFESFWEALVVRQAENPSYYLDWDVRGIVHAHNGYLDIAIAMGYPAMICALIVLIVLPLVDYVRCLKKRENVFAADFFMMCLTFALMNAFLESFFFRRADPVWLLVVMACFGLRMTARIPIATRT
ncbi:O-antigen ligase family protein [Phyllobacterium endophyticum]|uniref:Biotin transporter BioY n=1 Tax=Phyllobacterium endophyticum TaxID=1149773 RepID=A0A2P7B108_9HYPH|nr:O-antigen ligase [Phyllobacterium endophyticum]MBB3237691.1 O-antigen ligase [Phyllobacterium endophyticum]PSH60150.1 biotin transporter BioY [Phyllobacterium endophyticum]TYR42316.1 O-antigen ligase family protein [Phyllobacterium endophyticum]